MAILDMLARMLEIIAGRWLLRDYKKPYGVKLAESKESRPAATVF
jgi:hypothetical protein